MDVSVIIVNYNTTQLVHDCIETIYEHTKNVIFEIIVVDNNSPDRSIEKLNNIFPEVKLILNDKNSGFGAANNLGNKYAIGKYLFFLNSDTLLISNAIFDFFQFMERTPEAGVCGGNLLTKDLKPTISFERFKPSLLNSIDNLFLKVYKRIRFGNNRTYLDKLIPTKIEGYISGANFFTIKDIFDKIEGFDEDFFMYYEEVELTYRINNNGLDSYVLPLTKIIHIGEGSQLSINNTKLIWMLESAEKYYQKTNYSNYSTVLFLEKLKLKYIDKIIFLMKKVK